MKPEPQSKTRTAFCSTCHYYDARLICYDSSRLVQLPLWSRLLKGWKCPGRSEQQQWVREHPEVTE
jgi:hypothetical protein